MTDHAVSGHVPPPTGTSSAVRVYSVPPSQTVYVRFLADYVGVLTHRKGNRPYACAGKGSCPGPLHSSGTTWKGYAPCEVWATFPDQRWHPIVLEITERLAECLPDDNIRGQVWELTRIDLGRNRSEVVGLLNDIHDAGELRKDVRIEPAVCRIYHTTDILWGVAPPLPPRLILAPSEGKPPLIPETPMQAGERKLTPEEVRSALRKAGLLPGGKTGGK